MTENLLETKEGIAKLKPVLLASAQFALSPTFKEFCKSDIISSGMAIFMAEACLQNPALILAEDSWAELIHTCLAYGIVCWEDQELKEPNRG